MKDRLESHGRFSWHLSKVSAVLCGLIFLIGPLLAQESTSYTYDALGRLITTRIDGNANGGVQASTGFDPAGNRTSYSVSGANAAGNPVTLSIGNASATEGGQVTFTVKKSGVAPAKVTVNFATADGTAVAGSDYNAASGTLTFAPSESSKTITISTIDDTVNEPTETFSVSLSNASGASISNPIGTGTINDNDGPPTFSISDATPVAEGGTLNFTVTKAGPATTQSYSVNFATANGSAVAGIDYNASSGTLTFAPGETAKTISVSTIDDTVNEPTEAMTVSLSSPTGGATLSTATATGVINDNDAAPSFSINSPGPVTEGGVFTFTVTKSGSTTQTFAVNFATANGTAVAGSDYNAVSGTLTFAPGETAKTFTVSTIDDSINEATESFTVSLSGATGGATVTTGSATATINDNDAAPVFSISNAGSVTEGGVLTFTVTKSGSTALTYSVNYGTNNGTAIAGSDYVAVSGTFTFAPGETSKTFTVSTIDDTVYEQTETFSASISAASGGATIGTATGTATIIDNDPPPNQPPVAVNDYFSGTLSANCDYHAAVNVTANDYDPDNNVPLTVINVSTSDPNSSDVYVASSSSVGVNVYSEGTYIIQYQIKDTLGATAFGNLTLTVTNNGSCQRGVGG